MASDTYILVIDIDGKPAIKGLNDVEKAAKKTGKNIESGVSGGFDALGAGLNVLKTQFLALGALIGGGQLFSKMIANAIEQEEAINKLNTALKLTGNFSEQTSLDLQKFANDMQSVTTAGDDAALSMLGIALNFTKSTEVAKKMTVAAMDLAAATGKDLETAVELLGKTFAGTTGEIGKMIPAVKELSKEQLKSGAAIDLVADKFRGAATEQTKTFGGALKSASNNFGDVLEAMGEFITRSMPMVTAINTASRAFGEWAQSLKDVRIDLMGNEAEKTDLRLRTLKTSIEKTEERINAFKAQIANAKDETYFFGLITSQASTAQDSARLKIARLEPTLISLKKRYEELIQAQDKTKKSSVNVIDTAAMKAAQSDFAIYAQKIVDQRIALELSLAQSLTNEADRTAAIEQLKSDRVRSINMAFETDLESLKKTAREKNLANTAQYFEAEAQLAAIQMGRLTALHNEEVRVVEEKNRQIVASVKNVLVSGVVNGMAQLGAAVAAGQNAWESFGGSVLAILGDMMIQVGSSIVAQSTALQELAAALADPFLAGGGIVAGLALIALGGALKGAGTSRGGVGAVAPPASPTGGILGPVAGTPVTGPDVESPGKGQAITINVEGTVLDPRSVGRQIAQILQETFESNEAMVSYA